MTDGTITCGSTSARRILRGIAFLDDIVSWRTVRREDEAKAHVA